MKCWTSECLAEVPDPAQTEPYMDREEGSLSGSSGKQNELEHDTKALASIWPAAHRSPKLQSNSQGVSTQTDNGGISSRKLSKMTTVSYSLEKEGSCQHTWLFACTWFACEVWMQGAKWTPSAANKLHSAPPTDKTSVNATFFVPLSYQAHFKQTLSKVLWLNRVPWRGDQGDFLDHLGLIRFKP